MKQCGKCAPCLNRRSKQKCLSQLCDESIMNEITTVEGQSHKLGRTLFAIFRYFMGTIWKVKVYQYLAHLPSHTKKLLSQNYLKNFVNN